MSLSLGVFSVSEVCNRKITVYRINLMKVQKLVRDSLPSGFDTYPNQSKKPEKVGRREVTSCVQSLKLADLESAADGPPRKSRKQKLDKWQ